MSDSSSHFSTECHGRTVIDGWIWRRFKELTIFLLRRYTEGLNLYVRSSRRVMKQVPAELEQVHQPMDLKFRFSHEVLMNYGTNDALKFSTEKRCMHTIYSFKVNRWNERKFCASVWYLNIHFTPKTANNHVFFITFKWSKMNGEIIDVYSTRLLHNA
jgi:hypothetical protein